VKRQLAESGADLALITSEYVYDNFIGSAHGPVNADAYARIRVNVKNTHSHVWYRLAGGPPPDRSSSANGHAVRAASRQSLRALGTAK
jgi:hypothetical protein